ncbi:MAG: hypothetical protein RL757_1925 [Bacteroidota bacterium]|jgi:hypothetical protein
MLIFSEKSEKKVKSTFKNHLILLPFIATFGALLFSACAKDLGVGNDFVDGDRLNVKFTDTLTLKTSSVPVDSVTFLQTNVGRNSLYVGNYNDAIFGNVNAEIYTQISPNLSVAIPNFSRLVGVDSVIFTMGYDSTRCVGNFTNNMTLELYRLKDTIKYKTNSDNTLSIFSNQVTASETMPIRNGILTFKPNLTTRDSTINDRSELSYLLKWKLDSTLGKGFIQDFIAHGSDFQTKSKGFRIKASNNTSTMLAFQMIYLNGTRFHVFYRAQDSVTGAIQNLRYDFLFAGGLRYNYFSHDRSSSTIGSNVNGGEAAGDTSVFVESFNGSDIKIRMPHIQSLVNSGKIAINKAELELTVDERVSSRVANVATLFALKKKVDRTFETIADLNDQASYDGTLGAVAVNGTTVKRYKINITAHVQRIIDGSEPNEFYLIATNKSNSFARSQVFGPKSTKYPMKLNITYTKL